MVQRLASGRRRSPPQRPAIIPQVCTPPTRAMITIPSLPPPRQLSASGQIIASPRGVVKERAGAGVEVEEEIDHLLTPLLQRSET